jgi:hypothetical protein
MSNIVVSLHARTLLLSSATCASLPLRPVEQWEHSGLQLRRSTVQIPSDTNFVFAIFNLISRNQCVALQQRSLVHIQPLQINFCANYFTPGVLLVGWVGIDRRKAGDSGSSTPLYIVHFQAVCNRMNVYPSIGLHPAPSSSSITTLPLQRLRILRQLLARLMQ